jgi:hypothetical protein
MTTPMPPLRALACSIALAAVFGGAYAGPKTASAAADPPNYDGQPVGAVPVFPSTSPLGQSTSPSSRFVAAAPEVCFGRTENPHNSRHYPGNVLVSSRSECPPYAVTVTIDLYRVVFGIMQFLDRGTNTGMGYRGGQRTVGMPERQHIRVRRRRLPHRQRPPGGQHPQRADGHLQLTLVLRLRAVRLPARPPGSLRSALERDVTARDLSVGKASDA